MKKVLALLVLLAVVAGAAYRWAESRHTSADTIPATVEDIKGMVKLCALEINDDVPVRDSVNGKWIFAKGKLTGYVRFDLEQLKYKQSGDTLVVYLPPESVDIYESTEPGAYRVFDAWDDSLFGRGELTTAEENLLKQRMKSRYRDTVYNKGYVRRARKSAVETLSRLFGHLDGTVVIVDPTPDGSR